MNDTFKVGEIVIAVNWRRNPEYNGSEVEVIVGLKMRDFLSFPDNLPETGLRYRVRTCDGTLHTVAADRLRRKPSADEGRTVTRWADCPWQPEKERA